MKVFIYTVFMNAILAVASPYGALYNSSKNVLQAYTKRQIALKDSAAEFELFADYTSAAYCGFLHDGQAGTLICQNNQVPGACSNLKGVTTIKEFSGDAVFNIGAFIALDEARNELVVGFKGTSSLADVVTDLFKILQDTDLCSGCKVHAGFLSAFQNIKSGIEQVIDAQRSTRPNIRVIITGHSLGGAVATIMASYLRGKGKACDLYTYGCPRVGNLQFATFASNQQALGFSARITNQKDVVPAIPPAICGYSHTFPEYWYETGVQGLTRDKVRYDPYLRRNGLGGCKSEAECTSASCDGLFGLLGCDVADHSTLKYTGGFDACPNTGLGGLKSRLPNAGLPVMPLLEELDKKARALSDKATA